MNRGLERFERSPSPAPEMVTPEELIEGYYEESGLDGLLAGYANREVKETDVEPALLDYTDRLATLAYGGNGEHIDVDLVREGFERLAEGFDQVIHEKIVKPKGLTGALYTIARGRRPIPNYFRRLDDRFWGKQFMEEYREGNVFHGMTEEPDIDSFKHHVYGCAYGHMWSFFTLSV